MTNNPAPTSTYGPAVTNAIRDTIDDNGTTETMTAANRTRLVALEGDAANMVFRTSRKYNVTAAVYVAPEGERSAEQYDHAGVILTVRPDGTWTVATRAAGWDNVEPVTVAAGHVDQAPAPTVPLSVVARVLGTETGAVDPDDVAALLAAICAAAGVPTPVRYRFTQHNRPNGSFCPWSHVSVVAPKQRTQRDNRLCPDLCPASDVETDPTPDPDADN